jgi:tryptophan 2-C-methyltransferase
MANSVLLVNANTLRPPVAPIGLEYVGEALVEAGADVNVLDFSFESDWKSALRRALNSEEPLFTGLTVRNTDDCSFSTKKSFLPWITEVVNEKKQLSRSPVMLGGVGFSIMPEAVLETTGADMGIAGDGEETAVTLFRYLAGNKDISGLPNLVYRHNGQIVRNKREDARLDHFPLPRRRLFDNKRYEELGAQVGIETRRGCYQQCIYCADPVAKGRHIRVRPPQNVAAEFKDLLDQGVSWFHLCDSEFNLPLEYAKEVCRVLIEAGIGDRAKWYCYCSPVPFDNELARLMQRAGCRGINFGVDSLCDEQLARLERNYSSKDVAGLVSILKEQRINYMFDFLVGGPGETTQTVRTTIERIKKYDIPLAGIALGVRVYPGTTFGKEVLNGFDPAGLNPRGAANLHQPVFYISSSLPEDTAAFIEGEVGGDPRFLFLASPDTEANYNYAGDEALCQLIKDGARGAYWEILSRDRLK